MKKLLAMLLAFIMVLSLAACGSSAAPTEPEDDAAEAAAAEEAPASEEAAAPEEDGKYVIGFSNKNVAQDNYGTAVHDAVLKTAEELGVDITVLDARGDINQQANQIQNLIEQAVDLIVVWPENGQAVVPAVKEAYEKGIPVLMYNCEIDPSGKDYTVGFAGPYNYDQGVVCAGMAIDAYKDHDGPVQFVEITGTPGNTTSIDRDAGFRDTIEGTNIEIVESQPADFNREKGQQVMENYILKYPDLEAVYVTGDGMAIGAANAIRAAGKSDQIKIFGVSLSAEGYDLMENGEFYASTIQSPHLDGQNCIETAVKYLNGELTDYYNYLENIPISVDNISEIERPDW